MEVTYSGNPFGDRAGIINPDVKRNKIFLE